MNGIYRSKDALSGDELSQSESQLGGNDLSGDESSENELSESEPSAQQNQTTTLSNSTPRTPTTYMRWKAKTGRSKGI